MLFRMLVATIFVFMCSQAFAEAPPESFLNNQVYSLVRGRIADGGSAKLKEFVKSGLKPGTWSKVNGNNWIYRVKSNDPVTNKKVDSAFSFVHLNPLPNMTDVSGVVLQRVAINGKDIKDNEIYNLFRQIYFDLPTIKKALAKDQADSSNAWDAQLVAAKKSFIDKHVGKFEKYGQSLNKKTLDISSITNGQLTFSIKTFKGVVIDKSTFPYKMNYDLICDFSNKSTKFTIVDNAPYSLEAIYTEPDCSIKIETPESVVGDDNTVFLDVNYKGTCSSYCKDLTNKSKLSFSDTYVKTITAESEEVKDGWK